MASQPLPAHQTKDLASLDYPLPSGQRVLISQDDANTDSTGRTVWLGAQVLAVYLHDLLRAEKPFIEVRGGTKRRRRVIELGAGTGLLSLSLHHSGMDVVATDVACVAPTLLASNLLHNRSSALDAPTLEARTLDWFVDPTEWDWTRSDISSTSPPLPLSEPPLLAPPFDFIVTTDSVYHPSLTEPLLRSLHALSSLTPLKPPPVYLALEARDPDLIAAFLESAKETWGFKCSRTDNARLEKLLGEGGLGWSEEDWEGVQVWKLQLGRRR